MERRFLPALAENDHAIGTFATKWEGWKNPRDRAAVTGNTGRINVTSADDIGLIDDQMGLYVVLYEPSAGNRYVVYVGYSKALSTELKIRYGKWEHSARFHPRRSCYPFAALYVPNQHEARAYELDLIRYYCPPWNTKFHL